VEKAVSDLVIAGSTGTLLKMIREASRTNSVAERVRVRLTTPAEFQRLLSEGNMDPEALQELVEEMGPVAVEPLLDVLAESESRSLRRRVFDVLAGLGSFALERTIARLVNDGRWFVQRNMLALLQRLEQLPESFDLHPYLEHADHRVRREALPLAFGQPKLRDRVLRAALADKDERVVHLALAELTREVPDALVPTLINRVVTSEDRSPEVRAIAIQMLSPHRSHLVLSALIQVASPGKTLFGRAKVASSSPAVLAALRGLAADWGDHPEARALIERASKSRDADVRAAVGPGASARPGKQASKP
jgi:HEAT repeat protein